MVFFSMSLVVTEPSVYQYAERHDNIEAIYKKLDEKRDTADVTAVLKELRSRFIPNRVVACRRDPRQGSAHLRSIFAGKHAADETPALFVCQDFTCGAPVVGRAAAVDAVRRLPSGVR